MLHEALQLIQKFIGKRCDQKYFADRLKHMADILADGSDEEADPLRMRNALRARIVNFDEKSQGQWCATGRVIHKSPARTNHQKTHTRQSSPGLLDSV
jgi:hypothetical protein